MIIWGWRTVGKRIAEGLFSCPTCRCDRHFEHQRLRRFMTIFFIPLIPLKVVGEVVRCMTCRTDFRPEVLNRPTASNLGEGMAVASRVAIAAMIAGATNPSDKLKNFARETVVRAGTDPYEQAAQKGDVGWVTDDGVVQYLEPFVDGLSVPAREQFVGLVASVAMVDGDLTDRQRGVLQRIATTLGLTDTHLSGVLMKANAPTLAAASMPEIDVPATPAALEFPQ